MRPSGRSDDQLRAITLETGYAKFAEGSCLSRFGDTHVLCVASVEHKVPSWMRKSGKGWITAEYAMLPRATNSRMQREATRGKISGRTHEIQRLIGRSLRSVTDLKAMGEIQITLDCDVIQADGGTRTAAITGAYVALYMAFQRLVSMGILKEIPLTDQIAAVSCGIHKDKAVLDLDYVEDREAQVDANFVLTGGGNIVEIQGTAEGRPFPEERFHQLMGLAKKGIGELIELQRSALGLEKST